MASTIVGLDIGHGVLRAAEVSQSGKSDPKLLRYHEVTFPVDATREGEILEPDVLVRAVRQLWSTGKIRTKDVVLGIGNQRVLTRDLQVPRVPLERIRETLPFQVQDLLPIPVAEAVLDFYPISEGLTDSGPVINGLLVAAAKSAVLANVRAVQQAGLNPVDVDLIPFALSRALLRRHAGRGTIAIVHVGAMTTVIVVAKEGVPQFVRIIPSGGEDITKALVATAGLTEARAEETKAMMGLVREVYGEPMSPESEVVQRVTEELLSTIRATLAFYASTRPANPVAGLVLSGGGARLKGFAAALEEFTRLQVDLGDPTDRFVVTRGVDDLTLTTAMPSMAVALGLTLRSAA